MQQAIIESLPTTLPESLTSSFDSQKIRALTTIPQRAVEAAVVDTAITQTTPDMPRKDLTGAEVFYVLTGGSSAGQRRPAVVVRDWGNGLVNLQVFTDALNDYPMDTPGGNGILWSTSVHYASAATRTLGTWHWRTESF